MNDSRQLSRNAQLMHKLRMNRKAISASFLLPSAYVDWLSPARVGCLRDDMRV